MANDHGHYEPKNADKAHVVMLYDGANARIVTFKCPSKDLYAFTAQLRRESRAYAIAYEWIECLGPAKPTKKKPTKKKAAKKKTCK